MFLIKNNNKRRRVSVIHSKKGLPMDIVGFMVYMLTSDGCVLRILVRELNNYIVIRKKNIHKNIWTYVR